VSDLEQGAQTFSIVLPPLKLPNYDPPIKKIHFAAGFDHVAFADLSPVANSRRRLLAGV
jgi:hypothetical protein